MLTDEYLKYYSGANAIVESDQQDFKLGEFSEKYIALIQKARERKAEEQLEERIREIEL